MKYYYMTNKNKKFNKNKKLLNDFKEDLTIKYLLKNISNLYYIVELIDSITQLNNEFRIK